MKFRSPYLARASLIGIFRKFRYREDLRYVAEDPNLPPPDLVLSSRIEVRAEFPVKTRQTNENG